MLISFFISALLGGAALALGGAAYLNVYPISPVLAAALFCTGILVTLTLEFEVITDRIAKIPDVKNRSFDKSLYKALLVFLGNVIGIIVSGFFCHFVGLKDIALVFCERAAEKDALFTLFGSVCAGALMFCAYHGYNKQGGGFTGCAVAISAVTVMLLCRFDLFLNILFYHACALTYSDKGLAAALVSLAGNVAGVILFTVLYELKKEDGKYHFHRRKRHHKHHHHKRKKSEHEIEEQ